MSLPFHNLSPNGKGYYVQTNIPEALTIFLDRFQAHLEEIERRNSGKQVEADSLRRRIEEFLRQFINQNPNPHADTLTAHPLIASYVSVKSGAEDQMSVELVVQPHNAIVTVGTERLLDFGRLKI